MPEQVLQVLPTLGAGVDRQAGRLIDDQHQSVAIEHAGQEFIGRHGLPI